MNEAPDPAHNLVRLNAGGVEGKLTTPGGEQLPVRVFDRGEDGLMLVLTMLAEEDLAGQALLLEYASVRGLVRVRGEAVLEGRDLLRFRAGARPELLQRREFVRIEAVAPVVLTTEDDENVLGTHAIEVSGGGMLLAGPASLEPNTRVGFRLHLIAGEAPIDGHGRVVRMEGASHPVVVFDQISTVNQQRLIRFVFERQRDALARRGEVAPLKRPWGGPEKRAG